MKSILCVITDTTLQTRFSHVELALQASLGGADWVQFRHKPQTTTQSLITQAHAMRNIMQAKLLINDRVDVAAAVGAHGVHLGAEDLDPATARKLIGQAIIGATANSLQEALLRAQQPVDYLGVGPVFGTQSKLNAKPSLGLAEFAAIVRAVNKPVIAIGGIDIRNAAQVMQTGAAGIAVLSAAVCAPDVALATRRLKEALA